MTSNVLALIAFVLLAVPVQALAQVVVPIWGNQQPPYYKAHELTEYEADCWEVICVYQVVDPTLTIYQATGESGNVAVIVLSGGGYETEAVYHEGYAVAEALSDRGITAAVLKYRLPNPATSTQPQLVPAADVRQALQVLRSRQGEFGFEAERFGVLGFSAGSHLATEVSVHPDPISDLNPDFSMLIYGVSRLSSENHEWLEKTLYHRAMTEAEVSYQTLLSHVDGETPPAFLVHALDDEICHYTESTLYSEALTANGVDSELHLFAQGGHGFGLGRSSDGTDQWIDLAVNWLRRLP